MGLDDKRIDLLPSEPTQTWCAKQSSAKRTVVFVGHGVYSAAVDFALRVWELCLSKKGFVIRTKGIEASTQVWP